MSLERDIILLREIPILAGFGDEHLRLLAFGAEHVSFSAETVLFRAGETADSGYLIVNGNVNLLDEGNTGDQVRRSCGPGTLIGERAMLTGVRRPVTAIATQATEAIRIRRSLLRRMFEEYPDLARRVHGSLSRRVSERARAMASVGSILKRLGEASTANGE